MKKILTIGLFAFGTVNFIVVLVFVYLALFNIYPVSENQFISLMVVAGFGVLGLIGGGLCIEAGCWDK